MIRLLRQVEMLERAQSRLVGQLAIATSIMLGRVNGRQVFRFTFHFGLFQAAMPVVDGLQAEV